MSDTDGALVHAPVVATTRSDTRSTNVAGATRTPNSGAAEAARQARSEAAMRAVPREWRAFSETLFEPVSGPRPDVELWKNSAYERLVARPADFTTVRDALLNSPDQAPFLSGLLNVSDEYLRDAAPLAAVRAAVTNLRAAGAINSCSAQIVAGYVGLSARGKAWFRTPTADRSLMTGLLEYTDSSARRDGESATTVDPRAEPEAVADAIAHGGDARQRASRGLYNFLRTGRMAAAPAGDAAAPATTAAVATPTAAPAMEPALVQAAVTAYIASLRTRIEELRTASAARSHTTDTASRYFYMLPAERAAVLADLRALAPEVQQALRADSRFALMISELAPSEAALMAAELDPVERLWAEVDPMRRTAPAGGTAASGETAPVGARRPIFDVLREFMLAHATDQPLRMRVLEHVHLRTRVNFLPVLQREAMMRLIARGSEEITAIDALQIAVRNRNGVDAVRALLRAGSEDAAGVRALMSDLGFVHGISEPALMSTCHVDGVPFSPRDLFFTICGVDPARATDLGETPATSEDAAGETVRPLTLEERTKLNTELYAPTVSRLRAEFESMWADDAVVVAALRTFQNRAASSEYLPLLRAVQESPGPELTQRYLTATNTSLRTALHDGLDADARREAEEILGMTANSTALGEVGGAIVLAGERPEGAIISLEQALRETLHETTTLDQLADAAARQLHGELSDFWNIRDVSDVLAIWREFEPQIEPHLASVSTLTGRPNLHTIELVVNSYRPIGGDLYQALRNAFEDSGLDELTNENMPVNAASRRARSAEAQRVADVAAPEAAAERVAGDSYAAPAQTLFNSLTGLANPGARSLDDYSGAVELIRTSEGISAAGTGAFSTSGDRFGECTEANPNGVTRPGTFREYYREHYGITPDMHLRRVLRAIPSQFHRRSAYIAATGLTDVDDAIVAPTTAETPLNPELVTPGFTVDEGQRIAEEIWRILHEDGDVHLITTVLLGNRTTEERRIINGRFQQLSGGIDPVFYLQTALSRRAPNGLESNAYNNSSGIGADGTAAGNDIASGNIRVHGDVGTIESASDVATTGAITCNTRLRAATIQNNVNDIFEICEVLTPAERRSVIADHALMGQLHGICDDVAWDRVQRVLMGSADLTDRLYSRSTGDREGAMESIFGGTDEAGMTADIRAYIRRIRNQCTEQVVTATPPIPRDRQTAEIEARVRAACVDLLANPEVEAVLRSEMQGVDLTNAEGALTTAGAESRESALVGGGDAAAILTELRQMTLEERASHRGDPEFLLELQTRAGTRFDEAMRVLSSTTVATAEEDHIALLRTAFPDQITALLAQLTPEEYAQLQGDAVLMVRVLGRVPLAERAAARAMLEYRPETAAAVVGIAVTDPAADECTTTLPQEELARLAFLKTSAINRLTQAAGHGFDRILEETVQVYRMPLRPIGWGDRPSATAEREGAADPASAAETRLRAEIWTAVEPAVRGWCRANDGHGDMSTDTQVGVVERGVKKQNDPTGSLIGEFTAGLDDDEAGIERALRNVSDEKLIRDWSTVKRRGVTGTNSLDENYRRYRDMQDAVGEEATPEQQQQLSERRLAVERHTLDVSFEFEGDILRNAGGVFADRTGSGNEVALTTARDNPEYTRWVQIIRDRLPSLNPGLIAHEIGADDRPADVALIQSHTSRTLSAAAYRTEDYLHARGTNAGGMGAESEGAEVDAYMADYGHHLAESQITGAEGHGVISEAEAATAAEMDANIARSLTAFRAARAATAQMVGLLVATLIAVIISVVTMGAAAGPAAALLLTAVTAGAAATGQVLTQEAFQGQDFEAGNEGLQQIGAAVVTGIITGGTSILASRMMASLAPAANLAGQAAAVESTLATVPRTWGQIFSAAGRSAGQEMVGETLSNGMETGLAALDPTLWMQGFGEGMNRARSTVRSEIAARWDAPLRAGLISFLTSAMGARMPGMGGAHGPEAPVLDVNVERNIRALRDSVPESMLEAVTGWAVGKAIDGKLDPSAAPGELLQEFIQEMQEGAIYGHTEGIDERVTARREAAAAAAGGTTPGAVNTGTSPVETSPVETSPVETSPLESSPLESSSAETSPISTTPVETAPLESAPLESAPLESAPLESAPLESAPLESSPLETSPLESSPLESSPLESSPVQSTPVESTPLESSPLESSPLESSSAETSPISTTPVETAPLESSPLESSSLESSSLESSSLESSSAETSPISTTPVETAPLESAPLESTTAKNSAPAQAIDEQIAGPKHAQTDLHSHWMGNATPENMASELARTPLIKPGAGTQKALGQGYQLPGRAEGVNPNHYYYGKKPNSKNEFILHVKPSAPEGTPSYRAIVENGKFVKLEARAIPGNAAVDVSKWEPMFRQLVALMNSQDGQKLKHTLGDDKAITQRGGSGDAFRLVVDARSEINKLKADLQTAAGDDRTRIISKIDSIAQSTVEKALRSSDETDFNSAYEIRDELIKNYYGVADRDGVLNGATDVTSKQAELLTRFAKRPVVVARINEVIALEAVQTAAEAKARARKRKLPAPSAELIAKRNLIFEQFAYDRYSVDTVVRLALDNVTYTEQSNSAKKLAQRFDEQQLDFVKSIAKEEHPELTAQIDQLTIRYLAMLTTNNFGSRTEDVNVDDINPSARLQTTDEQFQKNASGIEGLVSRGDVVGMDVAGMEHFQFDVAGRGRFKSMFAMLLQAAKKQGTPMVFRPHVGEGAIDPVTGLPFAIDANRQVNADGVPLHVVRARENISQLLTTLQEIADDNGGKLPPEVIVRFGHATHATPAQAAQIQALGIIVEVNLSSNQVTGALSPGNPSRGEQDQVRQAGGPSKPFSEIKVATLDAHALSTLIFNNVEVALSTDGHDVMNTNLRLEFEKAQQVIKDVQSGEKTVRITDEQALAMNAQGGTAKAPTDGVVEVIYEQMSAEKKALFDNAYRKFFETAQRYRATRD